jgi:hypothetical protein
MSSFDYKAMLTDLRAHFAAVAGNDAVLRRLDFEEAMVARRDGMPSANLLVIKTLKEGVPDLAPHILNVALIARHSTGLVGEMLHKMPAAERDLYLACRRTGMISPSTPADVAQILLAHMIVTMESFLEDHGDVPFMQAQKLAMSVEMTALTLQQKPGFTAAPALEKAFLEKAALVEKATRPEAYFAKPARNRRPGS